MKSTLTTWSGSRIPFSWRILPRFLLGWVRYYLAGGPR